MSKITPPTSVAAVELYIKKTDQEINAFLHDQPIVDQTPNNLNLTEKQALASLSARRDITIKTADEGGSIVVMDNG